MSWFVFPTSESWTIDRGPREAPEWHEHGTWWVHPLNTQNRCCLDWDGVSGFLFRSSAFWGVNGRELHMLTLVACVRSLGSPSLCWVKGRESRFIMFHLVSFYSRLKACKCSSWGWPLLWAPSTESQKGCSQKSRVLVKRKPLTIVFSVLYCLYPVLESANVLSEDGTGRMECQMYADSDSAAGLHCFDQYL